MADEPTVIGVHTVSEAEAGERVDELVMLHFEAFPSRTSVRKAVRRGEVQVDGAPTTANRFAWAGQAIQILESTHKPPGAWDLPLELAYVDDAMAVVVKPPGVPVFGNRFQTLQNALVAALSPPHLPDALAWPRPVHRLDIRTGGLVVVARTGPAMVALGRAFEERRVHKRYRALVLGRLEGEGRVDEPVEGRAAVSRYSAAVHTRSLRTDWLTTVELWPETGRTHQLRRHLASLGHPVLGDDLYGPEGAILRGKGLYLFSLEVGLDHPITGDALRVTIDEPPKFSSHRKREQRRWERWQADQCFQGSKEKP